MFAELQNDDSARIARPDPNAQDVFIVHGHNDGIKSSVAEFVRRITGRDPIILHEQANAGLTIIEKFEQYAKNAGFAIILLTGDDSGGIRDSEELRERARQNVILEFGFFIGAIGRQRVAALYESGVEVPSDLGGLLYTSLDSEWRFDLGREMRAAGVTVDLNNVT